MTDELIHERRHRRWEVGDKGCPVSGRWRQTIMPSKNHGLIGPDAMLSETSDIRQADKGGSEKRTSESTTIKQQVL
uniref:Uncharacterized protein n=1 Tax=Oryza barthii TaxID=65489 RepID=A0A0D3GIB5_9ORYZ